MQKSKLINPRVLGAIAALKHTEYFVICDPGLPLPEGAEVIDLCLSAGIPSFMDILKVVCGELEVEGYILASELAGGNPAMLGQVEKTLGGPPCRLVPHEEFKSLCEKAKVFVVAGETTPHANIILIGGVPF